MKSLITFLNMLASFEMSLWNLTPFTGFPTPNKEYLQWLE